MRIELSSTWMLLLLVGLVGCPAPPEDPKLSPPITDGAAGEPGEGDGTGVAAAGIPADGALEPGAAVDPASPWGTAAGAATADGTPPVATDGAPGEVATIDGADPAAADGAAAGVPTDGAAPPADGGAVPIGTADTTTNDAAAATGGATDAAIPVVPAASAGLVTISGSLSYAGTKTGSIRLEFLLFEEGKPPTMVYYEVLPGPGPWAVTAPAGAGEIRIVAFLDQTGDGASSDDPGGMWPTPVIVGSESVSGIDLVLVDEPDLGVLAPNDHANAEAAAAAAAAVATE